MRTNRVNYRMDRTFVMFCRYLGAFVCLKILQLSYCSVSVYQFHITFVLAFVGMMFKSYYFEYASAFLISITKTHELRLRRIHYQLRVP